MEQTREQPNAMETAAAAEAIMRTVEKAKVASGALASAPLEQRNKALQYSAENLASCQKSIVEANDSDRAHAEKLMREGALSQAMFDRLKLDGAKLKEIIRGIEQVVEQKDPLGRITLSRQLDEGLDLYRITCPIGLIAVIFESRPDALPQITSLSLKSGNGVILKGGSEARLTNRVLFDCFRSGLNKAGAPPDSIALFETREAIATLLEADHLIDLVVPRGSNQLVRFIQSNTRIPVLGHADGVCHIYVDRSADIEMAVNIMIDSKIQYPAACNSVETLLLHSDIASRFIESAATQITGRQKQIRFICDRRTMALIPDGFPFSVETAEEKDWSKEYGDLTLSVKVLDSMHEAICHINKYGSHHTEAIITEDRRAFDEFFAQVNSAGVYLNASTRFADGFRYGFGAEVGISTGKLHPRGPVGLEGLVTYKYKVVGKGHIVADYAGDGAKQFTHKELDGNSSS